MRLRKMYGVLIGIGLAAITALGLSLMSGGRIIALDYQDFPKDELEKLIVPEPHQVELGMSGPLEAQAGSWLTWWAMKLMPGTFLVDVRLNGYKASLAVDTGAPRSFLSPQLTVAAQVSLTSSQLTIDFGVNGRKVPIYMGYAQELEMGNLRIQNLPVIVAGNQPVIKLLGLPVWKVDGLLGMEPLRRFALTLDYERGIVILRREPVPPRGDSALLQIVSLKTVPGIESLELTRPIVEGFVNSQGPYPCFIDTGTSAPVAVPPEIWQALGLEGQKQARLEIRLGELQLKGVPAVRAKVGQIIIGSNIFQAQGFKRLTLDFLAGKLYAER
ncbi:MAG: pepsin/retropepsin-like aspartic protease family protein [Candidatus Caldarchaeum sp.]